MKQKIFFFGLLCLLTVVSLYAQTPYFYYYDGKKQYLELDTKYIFVSAADDNTAKLFVSGNLDNATHQPFRVDIPEGWQLKTNYKRFWTTLNFEEKFSDEAYLSKLLELNNTEQDIIITPYFKNQHKDKIGLSNIFYVKLKSLNDTILLKNEIADPVIIQS
jgi:hypothetical protein